MAADRIDKLTAEIFASLQDDQSAWLARAMIAGAKINDWGRDGEWVSIPRIAMEIGLDDEESRQGLIDTLAEAAAAGRCQVRGIWLLCKLAE